MGLRLLYVEVEGFLAFKEYHKIDFQDSDLWAIIGDIGVGKSSILDAITFALFGYVRNQKRAGHDQIINDKSDKASAAVAFMLEGQRYRVGRKIIRRKKGFDSEGLIEIFDGKVWQPIPNTRKISELDEYIRRKFRLRLESFTSSAMLLQGKSANFFEAKPAEQRKMLMELTNLEFYPSLGEYVRKQTSEAESRTKHLTTQLEKHPEVSEEEFATAKEKAILTAEQFKEAEIARTMSVEMLSKAKDKERLNKTIRDIREEIEQSTTLANQIEELGERLKVAELAARQKIPVSGYLRMKKALDQTEIEEKKAQYTLGDLRKRYEEARLSVKEARNVYESKRARLEEQETELNELRNKEQVLQAQRIAAEEKQRIIDDITRLTEESDKLALGIQGWEQLENIVNRKSSLIELRRSLDALETAINERNNARIAVSDAENRKSVVVQRYEEAKSIHAKLEEQVKLLFIEEEAERDVLSSVQLAEQKLQTTISARSQATSGSSCPTCGRGIDEHTLQELEGELSSLHTELTELTDRKKVSSQKLSKVTREKEEAQKTERSALGNREKLAQEVNHTVHMITSLQAKADERHKTAASLWNKAQRDAAAAGISLENPKAHDAKERLLGESIVKEKELAAIEPLFKEMSSQKAKFEDRQEDLKRQQGRLLSLPVLAFSLTEIQENHTHTKEHLVAAEKALRENRKSMEDNRKGLGVQETNMHELRSEGEGLRVRADELSKQKERDSQRLENLWEDVVESGWPESTPPSDKDLETILERARPVDTVRKDYQAAELAKRTLELLADRVNILENEAQRVKDAPSVEDAQVATNKTLHSLQLAQKESMDASANHKELETRKSIREQICKERDEIDGEAALMRNLVGPLGRNGLQARLVHRALGEILEATNEVLGRISSDRLRLELEIGEEDDDFKILTRDSYFPERPKEFPFISGGQKFSVAVAMAIGIGQYLAARSGVHKAEFLVIDEGFGALNEAAKAEMLAELERISIDVGKVIVISHERKIQEFFEERYIVAATPEGGATAERQSGPLQELDLV